MYTYYNEHTKNFLDQKLEQLNPKEYIKSDPISVVREMAEKPNAKTEDIEICAIWTAAMSWGESSATINAAHKLMDLCEWNPSYYVKVGEFYDIPDEQQIYRTIKGKGFKAINHNLRTTYNKIKCVADYASLNKQTAPQLLADISETLSPIRIGSPERNSSCKRINQLLRWMVRKDEIDLGLWASPFCNKSDLFAVVDRETIRNASLHNLVSHTNETWNTVLELTFVYKNWDCIDPLKYDLVKQELTLLINKFQQK